MELEDVRQHVAGRVRWHDDEDVAVRVELGGDGNLHVTISSADPRAYYTQGVALRPDGVVELSAPDDGFTSPGAKSTRAGTASTPDEAADLVVREVDEAVDWLRQLQARAATSALPAEQPPVSPAALAVACEMWQGGRDSGSSRLRGAARALTGARHYFSAPFITAHEAAARTQPEALQAGIALLRAVNAAPHLDADGWNSRVDLPARGFAGRGTESKPDQDAQIERTLRTGTIEMPLWGVSLSPEVADSFGTRFLFELVGPFPAVPAWMASGIKDDEQELVAGGRYRVMSQEQRGETTHVRLRWIGASGDRVGADDVLLGVLGAVPGVSDSSLTRSTREEELKLRLQGHGNSAHVRHAPGSDEATVVRYWEPEPGWDARGDDPYAQAAAMREASRRTTVPADVDSIVAAVLRGKENA